MTYQPKAEFLRVMIARGFMQDCTDLEGLDNALMKGVVPAYIGFDCTAPSLHVGSLVPIMMLHWLQQTGHQPIVLMGGGTTRVGDPSGKDASRQLLTDEQIDENMAGIRQVFTRFITFKEDGGPDETGAIMPNNADWLDESGIHPVPARLRPAFLDQPDAEFRFGQAAARAGTAAQFPRIQLHAVASL